MLKTPWTTIAFHFSRLCVCVCLYIGVLWGETPKQVELVFGMTATRLHIYSVLGPDWPTKRSKNFNVIYVPRSWSNVDMVKSVVFLFMAAVGYPSTCWVRLTITPNQIRRSWYTVHWWWVLAFCTPRSWTRLWTQQITANPATVHTFVTVLYMQAFIENLLDWADRNDMQPAGEYC